ncbi:toprim domain-containing protein [Cohnella yongneupensis]|uniref:Toprim domain-containing protein n=1 Tax=Cohnella yongneupensis TaxID=425006 RepID=A0ABW0QZR3_9BACL
MAGPNKSFNKKPDVIVNNRATWIRKLEEFLRRLEIDGTHSFLRIPKHRFQGAEKNKQVQMLKALLDTLMKQAQVPTERNLHCPFHDDRHPSMTMRNHVLHCFSCHEPGETRDLFDFVKLFFGAKSFAEQKLKAIELLVEDGANIARTMRVNTKATPSSKNTVSNMKRPASASRSFSALNSPYYRRAWNDEDSRNYLIQRGISAGSAAQYNLKCWEYKGTKYLVIPCDSSDFIVRRNMFDSKKEKFWLMRGVPVSLFNSNRLQINESCLFVVESALDAITLEQIGYPAIALNGTKLYGKLLEKSNVIRSNGLYPILLMDNDAAGKDSGRKLLEQLRAKGIRGYLHEYSDAGIGKFLNSTKDVNESYQLDPDETTNSVQEIFQIASELSHIQPANPVHPVTTTFSNPLLKFGIADMRIEFPKQK